MGKRILLGFMLAAGLLSMWISNTATTLMMLPIALAVADQVSESTDDKKSVRRFTVALLLGLAYAANVGGMATPIGTPTNGIFLRQISEDLRPSFLEWLLAALPALGLHAAAVGHSLYTGSGS